MDIKFVKRDVLKEKPDQKNLGFGKYMTDYMFVMDWDQGIGWHDARIEPYGPIEINPSCVTLHYAQETFEGLKAYRTKDGRILLFRPEMNAKRMITSNERLCMPGFPEDMFVEAIEELVKVEKDWIPSEPETSLYIRPFVFATEASLGVHQAISYKFMVICCPVGAYYPEGINPVKILVEDELVRAVQGGTGFTKCGGNYAASILGQVRAEAKGCTQVLWLDGVNRKYVEEVGTMNIMFKINGEIYTAPIEGTVLPGVTRDSIIHILKDWGYKVNETHLSVDDLMKAGHDGTLEESFGTGTAAVISPVGEFVYKDDSVVVNDFKIGELTQRLYDYLTGIQWGNEEDKYGWTREVL
ncbi:branched-chain amino acid aminotransferase [Petralouisia muris]|jgi:branched-chain amino acid aminotransferase|uniref:Branched-chain amino acid aminotransferase n=1 Tax=Petralouisia muris TaxID=3032872 RepID=A0AC61RZ11_9FIRM|nr:branched-chain amino acid aminotransferase [Petralouisia muris]TGY97381.1 branched-chain amino acid aminotransferase [Petralouisia muris]